jgi:VCBS repeat-containing protein
MAAKTTVKVATLTAAAKDDNLLSSATGINEDHLSGNLNVLANDPGSAHLYSLTQDVSGLAGTATFPAVTTAFSAAGATISINADGTIAYNASNLNLTHLAEGVAFTDSFTYTVQMANGAYSTAVAHVELMGTNDAPTLAAIAAADPILDTAADDTPAAITGTLVGADADDGAVLTYSITGTSAFGVATVVGANYSFTADADAIDALQLGESATATFTATVTDEHGASASQTMAFTLVGANDTAEFGGVATGGVTEDGPLTTGDTVTVTDRDHDQSGFQAAADLSGAHGDFSFDEATGAWGYTLDNTDAAVQGLWSGETLTETLTVASIDGGTQDIVVTIDGADDAAVFGGAATGSVTEDGTLTTGGTVTVSDLDHDQSAFQAATLAELTGDHGTFTFTAATGAWGYTLNNADAAVQALNTGASLTDTMQVLSADGSAQNIVVTINGADEAVLPPTSIEPTPTKHVINNGLTSVNGHKVITDFVAGDLLQYAANLSHNAPVGYDNDGNGSLESTSVTFTYNNGNSADVQVVLVGYSGTVGFFHEA